MEGHLDVRRWLVDLGWMELVRRVWAIGYRVRMVETLQLSRTGYADTPWFAIEGGGPHPNPAVAKYADFEDFPFSPLGVSQALRWVRSRE